MSRPPAQIKGKPYKVTAAASALALLVALGLAHKWEGRRYVAYDDLQPHKVLKVGDKLKGTLTVCDGHTDRSGNGPKIIIGKVYTDAECDAWLDADMADARAVVIAETPELFANPSTAGAATDFVYNAGGHNYRTSTMVKDFKAGRIESGCKRLLDWKYSGGKFLQGLLNRRWDEHAKCVEGLEAA